MLKKPIANSLCVKKAVRTLHSGGVIAYPTEAVFGLGCDPLNQYAVQRILNIKKRPISKGLILIASDFEQLTPFLSPVSPQIFAKIMRTWPGPTTWLLPSNTANPYWLSGKHALQAVRVSNHPDVQAICRQFGGAIISTSANLAGRPATKSVLQVRMRFHKELDYILPAKTGSSLKPSIIRNGLTDEILRQ